MSAHTTIAARCAALSSAASQIIADAASFARQLRASRHDVNAINSDLVAIRLALDIIRDDFSTLSPGLPILLLEAVSGCLDCCATSSETLQKVIVRLSSVELRTESWHLIKNENLAGLRQDLEAVRSVLDLLVDLVVLFKDDAAGEHSNPSPAKKCLFAHIGREVEHTLLRRIDVEREHIEDLTEGRLPTLYTSLDRLRACTAFFLEENIVVEEPQKRSDSRSDSLDPSSGESPRDHEDVPPHLSSRNSTSNGIGQWIANVVSQIVHSPGLPPESFTISDPRLSSGVGSRQKSTPSRGTFYAESTTSGTRTHSSGAKSKSPKTPNRPRVDSPQLLSSSPPCAKSRKSAFYSASTIFGSDAGSIINQSLTSDKLAISKHKRGLLTKDQRVAIDWDLRNISRSATPQRVERIFWEGANPNVEDREFGHLIIRAAFELSPDVLRLLVEYGADISKTASAPYYSTAHAAVLGKQLDNLCYLAELGVPVDAPNANGETPLHLAVRTPGAYHIAKWLLEAGVDVNREAGDLGTPLHMALAGEDLDSRERSMMVELLMAHGAEGDLAGEVPVRRGKVFSVLGLI